jgi:hypothetical protein
VTLDPIEAGRAPSGVRRPLAALVAILVTGVSVTGACTARRVTSSSLVPVATTSPTHAAGTPASLSRSQSVPSSTQAGAAGFPVPGGGDVTAIGDSIMVDGMPNLRALLPGIAIDAVAGRQVAAGLAVLQYLARQAGLRTSLVVELGTNGTFTAAQFDRILSLAGGRHLVFLTNHCPSCAWVPSNNELLATSCTPDRNCTVADWEALADAHPEWFARDGVHMPIGGIGGQAFAELISSALGGRLPASKLGALPGRPLHAGRAT